MSIASKLRALVAPGTEIMGWEDAGQWQEKLARLQGSVEGSAPAQAQCLVYPHTSESLTEIVKYADANGWSILPCGSGSKLSWGGLLEKADVVVSSGKLNRIVEHAVGDLTVTVEAGVKLSELQTILEQARQFLPIDPAYAEAATVGGIVATADTGSWRQRYGSVRDLLLGVAFVRADGQRAKAGGRVVKNVAGYDLMKLFTGSYGTLGYIVEVTFRVYPLPAASATAVVVGQSEAIATFAQTLRNRALTPTATDILSRTLVQSLALGQGMGVAVRFQSIAESVQEQMEQVSIIAQQLGLQLEQLAGGDENHLWQHLQQHIHPATVSAITCKIGVVPTAAVPLLSQLDTLTSARGFIHASSGLGKLCLDTQKSAGVSSGSRFELAQNGLATLEKMRSLCQEYRGFLTVLEAPVTIKQQFEPWGYTGNALSLMRKLKHQFDPNHVFSPGRFVGGI